MDRLPRKFGGEGFSLRQINVGDDDCRAGVGQYAAGGFTDATGTTGD